MSPVSPRDTIVRSLTADDSFRVMTTDMSTTARELARSQGATGEEARLLGELAVGTVLFRETMAPTLRVQGIVKTADERGQLIADSHPSGDTRGLVQRSPEEEELSLGPGSTLRMMRTLPDGRINQGIVTIPEGGGISAGLMAYMATSEQIVTMIGVGVLLDDSGQVSRAGGYLVQLLPGAKKGPLMVMTERLRDFEDVRPWLDKPDFSPDLLQEELLYAMDFTRLEERAVRFGCWCDEARVLAALATLSHEDLSELIRDEEVLEIACDYCKRPYQISPSQLRGLLATS